MADKSRNGGCLLALGYLLLAIALLILFVGEIFSAKNGDMLKEVGTSVVEADSLAVMDTTLEGKAIHAVGLATTPDILSDEDFGFSANAIYLKRNVLYYQLIETSYEEVVGEDEEGDDITETRYEYHYGWAKEPVSSRHFYERRYRDTNFVLQEISTAESWARNVNFGAYRLSEVLIRQMTSCTGALTDNVAPEALEKWNEKLIPHFGSPRQYVRPNGTNIYFGAHPDSPRVGDVRVSFDVVLPQEVSRLCSVAGDSLSYYYSPNKARMAVLKQGNHPAEELIKAQGEDNSDTTASSRAVGFLQLFFGLWIMIKGYEKRSGLSRFGEFLVRGSRPWLSALILSVGGSFALCSLPWFFYNPGTASIFLAIGAGILAAYYFFTK